MAFKHCIGIWWGVQAFNPKVQKGGGELGLELGTTWFSSPSRAPWVSQNFSVNGVSHSTCVPGGFRSLEREGKEE